MLRRVLAGLTVVLAVVVSLVVGNSGSHDCAGAMRGGSSDSQATVTVTYTQNGRSATQTASAYICGYCGSQLC